MALPACMLCLALACALMVWTCAHPARVVSLASLTRAAVDTLPSGICLGNTSGVPILVNNRMDQLACTLTGHSILDARAFWRDLSELGCARLLDGDKLGARTLEVTAPDGSIWQFVHCKTISRPSYLQIQAIDVTAIARARAETSATNELLREQNARQQLLLQDVEKINLKRETLSARMQAHRSLGECLLMTQKAQEKVAAGTAGRERDQLLLELVGRWQVVLRGLGSVGPASEEGTSDVAELEDVAALIGCRIAWAGQLPEDKAARSMVLSAVREALSNAARHARATALNVSCEQQDGWTWGFGPFGFGFGFGNSGAQQRQQSQPNYDGYDEEASNRIRAAVNYINSGYYAEAWTALQSLSYRSALWYYLAAIANSGLGNNLTAQQFAEKACEMEPNNAEYRQLLEQFRGGSSWYQDRGVGYGRTVGPMGNMCIRSAVAMMICFCCSSGAGAGLSYLPCLCCL